MMHIITSSKSKFQGRSSSVALPERVLHTLQLLVLLEVLQHVLDLADGLIHPLLEI